MQRQRRRLLSRLLSPATTTTNTGGCVPDRPLDLERCKLDLLKLLMHTRDFNDGWEIDEATRYLYGNLRSFDAWVRGHRRVDNLGTQMRHWLRRDLIPVVEQTRFFTIALPANFPGRRKPAALRLMRGVRDWVNKGATLDGDFFTDTAPPPPATAEFGRGATGWLERGMHSWFERGRFARIDDGDPPLLLLQRSHHHHHHRAAAVAVVVVQNTTDKEEEEAIQAEYALLSPILALL
jgi:hypothetical protein